MRSEQNVSPGRVTNKNPMIGNRRKVNISFTLGTIAKHALFVAQIVKNVVSKFRISFYCSKDNEVTIGVR